MARCPKRRQRSHERSGGGTRDAGDRRAGNRCRHRQRALFAPAARRRVVAAPNSRERRTRLPRRCGSRPSHGDCQARHRDLVRTRLRLQPRGTAEQSSPWLRAGSTRTQPVIGRPRTDWGPSVDARSRRGSECDRRYPGQHPLPDYRQGVFANTRPSEPLPDEVVDVHLLVGRAFFPMPVNLPSWADSLEAVLCAPLDDRFVRQSEIAVTPMMRRHRCATHWEA